MQIICLSEGSLGSGRELAESLSRKLDYDLLTREKILEMAADEGIAVGRLETAIVKRRPIDERLMLDKELYQAFITKLLCERALSGNLVYAGRTGHMLLPNVTHILRIRVVTDMESRITSVMQRLRLSREKAKSYIESVEDDRERWARTMYNVNWEFAGFYDLVVNLEQVSTTSAATALCAYAELPEFRETPASRKALEGLLLAARARLALARDKRTYAASVKVRANESALSVTYLPKDGGLANVIPEVLGGLSGVRELRCTMATTNVLWVQECFDPSHPDFQSVTGIAERWNAAVEVLRVVPAEGGEEATEVIESAPPPPPEMRREVDGGIEDDVVTPPPPFAGCDDEGLRKVFEELSRRGIAGGMRTARSDPRHIGLAIDRTVPYSLVVIGEVFVGKGHAASQRLTRELRAQLADALRVPVIKAEELKSQYFLGPLQALKLAGFALGVLLLYLAVFSYQREVLEFLTPETTPRKLLAAVVVMVFVPTLAYLYGTLTKSLLKLVKIE